MAQIQKKTVHDFICGKTGSKSSNLKTVELDNGNTGLVGYNRAVYAEKSGDEIIVYLEWDGYSKSTSNHFRMLRNAVKGDSKAWMTGKTRKKHFRGD